MNARLAFAAIFIPEAVKKKKLLQLFRLTAQAFQSEMPEVGKLSLEENLHLFGVYSGEKAENTIAEGDVQAVKTRLFRNAFWLGSDFRRALRPKTTREIMRAAEILYRVLGIDFQGDREGRIIIRKCFFSRYYSNEVCELMSSLDQGILAGLSNGGELLFHQRMTEGKDVCRAEFITADAS